MATAEEILEVRQNTDEPTQDNYSDIVISTLIDANGIDRASEKVWLRKAASWADEIDVSENGSSHSFGSLSSKAITLAKEFSTRADKATIVAPGGVTTIGKIVR